MAKKKKTVSKEEDMEKRKEILFFAFDYILSQASKEDLKKIAKQLKERAPELFD